jgi:hypothetical protein
MTDEQQNEQKQELRDLDLPEEQAEEVKGGRRKAGDAPLEYIKVRLEEVRVTS